MESQKLRLTSDYHLSDLINEIDKGDLRLPRFQRDYVWNRPKVIGLLDSIYNQFPIGSFFIWYADARYRSLYKNIAELDLPEPKDERQLRYILDGQQRATSLYVAIKGKTVNGVDYGKICFDLEREKFVAGTSNNVNLIALKDIVDPSSSIYLVSEVPPEYRATFQRCALLFQKYPLSVVGVRDMELGNAIEIFERINKGGVRLSIFDLVVATTWSEDFDLKVKYEALKNELRDNHFGVINPEIVTHSASLILKKYCSKSHQLSLKTKDFEEHWKEIETAIRLAIDYLRQNLGVKSIEFMPYPSTIALVAYAFYHTKGRSLTPKLEQTVKEWFWKSALTERYSASLETRLGEDRRDIIDAVLAGKEPKVGVATLNEERIRGIGISTKSAIRNAFFCMLAMRAPRHFKTGALFPIESVLSATYGSVEKHHIFPRAYLQKHNLGSENLIANFCFIPAELNKEISSKVPSKYFLAYSKSNPHFQDTLDSHFINYDEAIESNDYEAFLQQRSHRLFKEFELLVGSQILKDLSGDANKVLDRTEQAVRKLIIRKLAATWDTAIPHKLRAKLEQRLLTEQKHTATVNQHVTNFEELEQLDMGDYAKIIENNWDDFADDFENMSLMKARFNAMRRFRNDIKHSRTINDITKREGEAAIDWINRCIKV